MSRILAIPPSLAHRRWALIAGENRTGTTFLSVSQQLGCRLQPRDQIKLSFQNLREPAGSSSKVVCMYVREKTHSSGPGRDHLQLKLLQLISESSNRSPEKLLPPVWEPGLPCASIQSVGDSLTAQQEQLPFLLAGGVRMRDRHTTGQPSSFKPR